MPSIYKKIIYGKPFFYLTEQIRIKGGNKKIQVYLGKAVPKDLSLYYARLEKKESDFIREMTSNLFVFEKVFDANVVFSLEDMRIHWKYMRLQLKPVQWAQLWRRFVIQFIFESNAIEGSRLSQKEVDAIARERYIKKTLARQEVREVKNALRAFAIIQDKTFSLNERSLIRLHAVVTEQLNISKGLKKKEIIVNNKPTTSPGRVRSDLSQLFSWWKNAEKSKRHPLAIVADFHSRFENIHPFEDGNGRVGRLLFNWMLLRRGYPPILFRYTGRQAYFSALNQADQSRKQKWYWLCIRTMKQTVREMI